MRTCGTAELQSYGDADLRSNGATGLQTCGATELRGCGAIEGWRSYGGREIALKASLECYTIAKTP